MTGTPQNVWSILARAEERYGAAPAWRAAPGTGATYAELADAARRLAGALRARGVEPGDRVALLDHNTPLYLEATFGVAALGAVLQPLNHRLAAPELERVLADARTRLVLHGAAFRASAEEQVRRAPRLRRLEVEGPVGAEAPLEGPLPGAAARPADLAHLYFTSGTSGRPKGVCLTHGNVCVHAAAAVRELGLHAGDHWGHFAPMFHLADAWATLAITLVGGLHVLAPRFEADAVLDRIERERVTITNLVPTMLGDLVERLAEREFDPSSLRRLLSGGAPIAPALVERIEAGFRCEYVQTYGMTETSPYLTLSLLPEHLRALPADEARRYRARTGRPFEGVELEVVDERDRPVPADDRTVGEIRVRGATVSPGYWEREEETRAAFRNGWLYTGDLAVVDAEGFVDIVDRRKDMILTGGENVYSIEVESALLAHPDVLEAAVFGRPDARLGERVCAHVVCRRAVSPEALAIHCRERIAGYKVPRELRLVTSLPRTGSGKISKAAIRAAIRATAGAEEERTEAPGTES